MRVEVTGGAVRVGEIFCTLVIIIDDSVQCCSGFVHGAGIMEEYPAYVYGAAVLHALRVLRKWMVGKNQENFDYVDARA